MLKTISKKLFSTSKQIKNKTRIGMIGFGRIGKVHMQSILSNPRIELSGVAEIKPDNFSKEDQETYKIQTLKELFEKKLDGIVVASNTENHVEHILFTLSKNIPVFTEKPVSFKPDEVQKCFDFAKKQNLPLFCGFTRRFDPSLQEMVKEIKNGYVGNIHLVRATFRDYPPGVNELVANGSFIEDCGVHDINFINHILDPNGDNPIVNQWARGESHMPSYKKAGVDDTCQVFLKYKNNQMAIIDLSRKANCGYDIKTEIIGDKGMLLVETPKNNNLIKLNHLGVTSSVKKFSYPQTYQQAFYNEIDEFVTICEKVRSKSYNVKDLPVSERDCVMTAKISASCEQVRQEQTQSLGRINPVSNEKLATPTFFVRP